MIRQAQRNISILLIACGWLGNLVLPPGVFAQNQPTQSAAAPRFNDGELPGKFFEKNLAARDLANQILSDWSGKNYNGALEKSKTLGQMLKSKREVINQIAELGDSKYNSGELAKAGVLHLVAYQALKAGNRVTVDDTVMHSSRIVKIITATDKTDAERTFANHLVKQALNTRKIGGGVLDSDAALVLLHAKLEFSLKHWDEAIKEYEYWIRMYESKGKNPPDGEKADAYAELGIAYTSLKNNSKAEEYFKRATVATKELSGTFITPIKHYDVQDFLIYTMLNQGRLDIAKELAEEHVKFKETTLGLRSPELAEELKRYADLFDQAGETAFSFSLRSRAAKVTSP